MKKYIAKIMLFLVLMLFVDRVVGFSFDYFVEHSKGGYTGHHQYINNELDKEILVFGSSRAIHHYDSKMIEDSLEMSCYNCGQEGSGIISNYGQWLMIRERCQPKLIIYDLYPGFDLIKRDNHKFLGWLKPYYWRNGISDIFAAVDVLEKYKMLSKMYQYNYNPIQVVADYIMPIMEIDEYGFRAQPGVLDTMQIKKETNDKIVYDFDSLKIHYIEQLIKDKGDADIVFVISPCWYGLSTESFQPALDIIKKEGLLFYDFANDPKYVHNDKYYIDGSHLNAIGAEEFTKDLITKLKQ